MGVTALCTQYSKALPKQIGVINCSANPVNSFKSTILPLYGSDCIMHTIQYSPLQTNRSDYMYGKPRRFL